MTYLLYILRQEKNVDGIYFSREYQKNNYEYEYDLLHSSIFRLLSGPANIIHHYEILMVIDGFFFLTMLHGKQTEERANVGFGILLEHD